MSELRLNPWPCPNCRPEVVVRKSLHHDVLQSHLSFGKQCKSEFAKMFRLITYDLRGNGDLDKPAGRKMYLDEALSANHLNAAIDMRVNNPEIVPWSMGGLPTGTVLAKYGDHRFSSINFVDSLTTHSRAFVAIEAINAQHLPNSELNIDARLVR